MNELDLVCVVKMCVFLGVVGEQWVYLAREVLIIDVSVTTGWEEKNRKVDGFNDPYLNQCGHQATNRSARVSSTSTHSCVKCTSRPHTLHSFPQRHAFNERSSF